VSEARRIEVQHSLPADGDLGSKRRFAMGAIEGGIPLARSFVTDLLKRQAEKYCSLIYCERKILFIY
jgi:hypothetical protein